MATADQLRLKPGDVVTGVTGFGVFGVSGDLNATAYKVLDRTSQETKLSVVASSDASIQPGTVEVFPRGHQYFLGKGGDELSRMLKNNGVRIGYERNDAGNITDVKVTRTKHLPSGDFHSVGGHFYVSTQSGTLIGDYN